MNSPIPQKEINFHSLLIRFSVLLVFFLLSFLIFYALKTEFLPLSADKLGTFGDYIGGILNPTIAGLALIWLVYSVRIQTTELKATNNALSSTMETAKQQQEQISIQNFENLFFELLKMKNDAINEIIYIEPGDLSGSPPLQGKNAIKHYITNFKDCNIDWEKYYTNSLLDIFGSYFRICYQIVKLIDNNKILQNLPRSPSKSYSLKQKEYFDLFRSTLTQYELEAFFFNCLSSYGNGKFKKLVEKYGLFEPLLLKYNTKESNIKQPVNFAFMYDIKAFENNRQWISYFINIASIDCTKDAKSIRNEMYIIRAYKSQFSMSTKDSYLYSYDDFLSKFRNFLESYSDFNDIDDPYGLNYELRGIYSLYQVIKDLNLSREAYVMNKYNINPDLFLNFKLSNPE